MHDLPLLKLRDLVKEIAIAEKLSKSEAEAMGELHRKTRTDDDQGRAMLRQLEDTERGGWSNVQIAGHCGVGEKFVRSLRPSRSEEKSPIYRIKHGTEAVMDITRIGQRADDGSINTTAMCQATRKRWPDYRRLQEIRDLLAELSGSVQIPTDLLTDTITTGPNDQRGTRVHSPGRYPPRHVVLGSLRRAGDRLGRGVVSHQPPSLRPPKAQKNPALSEASHDKP